MSDYKVEMINDGMQEFYVEFNGPKESSYQGGVWKIRVELPDAYPYKSPSIGFVNKIYHPNVDELSGSVCLDVINQTWSPMFEFCEKYAKPEDIGGATEEKSSDDEELSEDEYASSDEAVAGQPDP
ncbi:hypothetical protein WN943_013164 [Citrus x changshan-huyou]